MIFNSLPFLVFLPIVFGLYWLPIRKSRWQNTVVLSASLSFHAFARGRMSECDSMKYRAVTWRVVAEKTLAAYCL